MPIKIRNIVHHHNIYPANFINSKELWRAATHSMMVTTFWDFDRKEPEVKVDSVGFVIKLFVFSLRFYSVTRNHPKKEQFTVYKELFYRLHTDTSAPCDSRPPPPEKCTTHPPPCLTCTRSVNHLSVKSSITQKNVSNV